MPFFQPATRPEHGMLLLEHSDDAQPLAFMHVDVHVPVPPHVWHVRHLDEQHLPFVQMADAHWLSFVHVSPYGFLHVPVESHTSEPEQVPASKATKQTSDSTVGLFAPAEHAVSLRHCELPHVNVAESIDAPRQ